VQLLRRLHLYLGCLFAPALIFFAVTGTWQLYRLHDVKKSGSSPPPAFVRTLSAVHMNMHLPGKKVTEYTPLRIFFVLAAAGLLVSTVLGVVMAFRFSKSALTPAICLVAGVGIPCLVLYIYR
jgi:uncharacterized iron-regulated membrane protein